MTLVIVSGCATSTTTTHYGIFEAENAAGDLRTFRVYWEVVEVQDFGETRTLSSPLFLETQCSDRKLAFYDQHFVAQRTCMEQGELGIAFCGDPRQDLDHRALPIQQGKTCGYVTDSRGAPQIKQLGEDITLIMRCQPRETEVTRGREIQNKDYLKPSAIPYLIKTKSVPGSERDGHVPRLWNHSSVCDPNQGR